MTRLSKRNVALIACGFGLFILILGGLLQWQTLPKERALTAWAHRAEEGERRRIEKLRLDLDNERVVLQNDTLSRPKNRVRIELDRARINASKFTLQIAEDWLATCSELVSSELRI